LAKLVAGTSDKLCANCYGGGITKMDKLPQLKEVYICPVCSGTEYYIPEEIVYLEAEEEEVEGED
jgi:excinuclease UvrABC ATPase subunit